MPKSQHISDVNFHESESGKDEVDAESENRPKKAAKKKTTKKSISENYEPGKLKRGHFTDVENEVRSSDSIFWK